MVQRRDLEHCRTAFYTWRTINGGACSMLQTRLSICSSGMFVAHWRRHAQHQLPINVRLRMRTCGTLSWHQAPVHAQGTSLCCHLRVLHRINALTVTRKHGYATNTAAHCGCAALALLRRGASCTLAICDHSACTEEALH